jgi:hypothetical protein
MIEIKYSNDLATFVASLGTTAIEEVFDSKEEAIEAYGDCPDCRLIQNEDSTWSVWY